MSLLPGSFCIAQPENENLSLSFFGIGDTPLLRYYIRLITILWMLASAKILLKSWIGLDFFCAHGILQRVNADSVLDKLEKGPWTSLENWGKMLEEMWKPSDQVLYANLQLPIWPLPIMAVAMVVLKKCTTSVG